MTGWDLFCAVHLAGELEVLGPKCEQVECLGLVATCVQWPTGPVRCCERHTARWREIAEALGMHLVVEPVSWTPARLDDSEQRFRLLELD